MKNQKKDIKYLRKENEELHKTMNDNGAKTEKVNEALGDVKNVQARMGNQRQEGVTQKAYETGIRGEG